MIDILNGQNNYYEKEPKRSYLIELSTIYTENITHFPHFTFVREQYFLSERIVRKMMSLLFIYEMNPQLTFRDKLICMLLLSVKRQTVTKNTIPWSLPRINNNRTNEGIGIVTVLNLDITQTLN